MAGTKISELPVATTLTGAELVPVVQSGATKQSTVTQTAAASWAAYVPAGTGAVTTTVQTKLRETVSVFDFMTSAQVADVQSGAASIDVTAAIQAAIDASTSVYIPNGTYKVTSTIYLRRGLKLSGASMTDTIIDGSTMTTPVFANQLNRYGAGFANQGLRDATIEQFKIVGNTASTSNDLIRLEYGFHRTNISRIWFYSSGGDGIYIDADTLAYGGYYNVIEKCVFGDPSDFSTGYDASLIKGNAIYAKGSCNQNVVRECIFWRIKKSGVYLEGSATWSIQRWSIIDNGIEGCGHYEPTVARYGIAFGPYSLTMNVSRNYIEGNALFTPYTSGGAGVWASASSVDLTIRDNLFSSNQYAIKLDNVDAAVIDGNSWVNQSTYYDIKITSVGNGTVYIGNNPSFGAIANKYLDVAVAAQPKVYGDTACALKRGTTCLAGSFTPKLYGGSTEISCSTATGFFERQGNRLRVNFNLTVSNLNGATGLIGIAGTDGINFPLPGLAATVQYPFKNDAALVATTNALYTSNVTLTADYEEVQLIANQSGTYYAFLREQGSGKANQNLNATALAVGSILRGEFIVYV